MARVKSLRRNIRSLELFRNMAEDEADSRASEIARAALLILDKGIQKRSEKRQKIKKYPGIVIPEPEQRPAPQPM